VQDVYKFDERRIIAGRVESGRVMVGDRLIFSPSNKTARVASIEAWHVPGPVVEGHAGQSIGLTLDEQIFVERGEIASRDRTRRSRRTCSAGALLVVPCAAARR
jgi:bifunctional enzyme CysN/CysC